MQKSPAVTIAFISCFLGLLIFFNNTQPYQHHFFSHGTLVILYNMARLVLVAYLLWLFYAVGNRMQRLVNGNELAVSLESALISCLTGIGIWQIILFCLGLAGHDTQAVISTLSSIVLFTSLPQLRAWITYFQQNPIPLYWPGILLTTLPLAGFLITKGLYPAGGHDYYNHYFQFYKKVIESGSIMPNEVWYHFYYSKGAGLFFLAMLLSDPLGPQLASTALILLSSMMIFTLLRQASTWRWLPWLGIAFYLTFLIYTPGPPPNMHQGGWGDLEKPHEPAAVLLFGVLWLAIGLLRTTQPRTWGIALIFTALGLVMMSLAMTIFIGAYLSLMTAYLLYRRKTQPALWMLLATFATGTCLIALLALNYYLTGIPQDQGLFLFWPIINFAKVNAWGVSFELHVMYWLKSQLVAQQTPINGFFMLQVLSYLRLDIWWPLCLTAIGIALWRHHTGTSPTSSFHRAALIVLSGFLVLIALLAMMIGRDQPISFYRFTSFTYAPMLCFCLLLLVPYYQKAWKIILTVSVSFAIILTTHLNGGNFGRVLNHGIHFASGQYSIADAYRNQRGWPGRMPWGGIYPAAEVVWSRIPPNTRVWSMHVHSYCMLPDCRFEGYLSYRLSPHANLIYFGDPNVAKAILKSEHLNYFFISQTLALTDPLPLSPLFSPEHIAHYLGISWTDGNNTLLTWKEDANMPLDAGWVQKYKQQVAQAKDVAAFPINQLRNHIALAQ